MLLIRLKRGPHENIALCSGLTTIVIKAVIIITITRYYAPSLRIVQLLKFHYVIQLHFAPSYTEGVAINLSRGALFT